MKHAFRHPIPIAWMIILFPVCLVAQVLMCFIAMMPGSQVVHRVASEVGAVLTAVATTTILAPIPVWKRVRNRRADP